MSSVPPSVISRWQMTHNKKYWRQILFCNKAELKRLQEHGSNAFPYNHQVQYLKNEIDWIEERGYCSSGKPTKALTKREETNR